MVNNVFEQENEKKKEIDKYSKFNGRSSLKVILLTGIIALVLAVIVYGIVKVYSNYTVTFVTYGGTVYGEEKGPDMYRFKDRTVEPKLKKEGYYVAGYSTDPDFKEPYTFGTQITKNLTIYVNWQPGYACQLRYAEDEENDDLPLDKLKILYEEYMKPESDSTLPLVYNNKSGSIRYGEQLLWYETPDCEGFPIEQKTYHLDKNIVLYGKWFDVVDEHYEVQNGVLIRYTGHSKNLMFPSKITSIKDINSNEFTSGTPVGFHDDIVHRYSCFYTVAPDTLKLVYINKECTKIGDNAFRSCDVLENVYFMGENITTIGEQAFADCHKLSKFKIPNLVTVIKEKTFYNTNSLLTIQGGNNITTIEDSAFTHSGIVTIELASVTHIGKGVFMACDNLNSVTFGSSEHIITDATIGLDNVFETGFDGTIYVNSSLLNYYKTTTPWSAFADNFKAITLGE